MSAEPRLHRSYLYAPGSDPRLIAKALAAGADAVVLDLEDAVAPHAKVEARRHVAHAVAATATAADVHVRINRTPDGFDAADVRAVVQPGLDALRLPKVESPDHVRALDELLVEVEQAAGVPAGTVALYPTVESALGAVRVPEIVRQGGRLARLAFGATDFLADIGASRDDGLATLHVRSDLVLHSRAARVGPPIDSVHTRLDDPDGLRRSCEQARALGFFGKSVIHPRQLDVVHQVFSPTPQEVQWARRVLRADADADASGRGAVAVAGEFVDAAVVARARSLLEISESYPT